MPYLLAEAQDLEALEVGQVLPSVGLVGLLGEAGLGPLAIDLVLLPQLLNGAGTGSTGQLGDGEGSEGSVSEGKDVAGHDLLLLTGGTVNQDLDTDTVNNKIHRFAILCPPEYPFSMSHAYCTVADSLGRLESI